MTKPLSLLFALVLLSGPASATDTPPGSVPPVDTAAAQEVAGVPKITSWDKTGMVPIEAREWQSHDFKPQEALDWKRSGFTPLIARTWSDKGFDPEEAREWVSSARQTRTLMAELDQSDPAQWKREGFTPRDRLAWWEAGFTFEDAVALARTGMSPADAAWHGHDKLKELRTGKGENANGPQPSPSSASTSTPPQNPGGQALLSPLLDLLKAARAHLSSALVLVVVGLGLITVFLLYRLSKTNKMLTARLAATASRHNLAPEDPTEPATPAKPAEGRGSPIRKASLHHPTCPTCAVCGGKNVRPSQMQSRRSSVLKFTRYYRCRDCGRHFALVNYGPLLAAVLLLIVLLGLLSAAVLYANAPEV